MSSPGKLGKCKGYRGSGFRMTGFLSTGWSERLSKAEDVVSTKNMQFQAQRLCCPQPIMMLPSATNNPNLGAD